MVPVLPRCQNGPPGYQNGGTEPPKWQLQGARGLAEEGALKVISVFNLPMPVFRRLLITWEIGVLGRGLGLHFQKRCTKPLLPEGPYIFSYRLRTSG